MTDLESPKKNNDCYFYYYSTCAKGDNCTFRHEPSALGCETMCSFWKEGKCLNVHCNFRHMELRKNRKVIPCYWESQPVGCLKAHCPFLHQNPRPSDEETSPEKSNKTAEKSNSETILNDKVNQQSERKVTAVDSLVVNFEEESDNESMPTFSPIKTGNRIVKVKTLEEIKLEKIQAESAAYYSYYDQSDLFPSTFEDADDLRQRIINRMFTKNIPQERTVTVRSAFNATPSTILQPNKRLSDDQLASILGDESLRKKQKVLHQKAQRNFKVMLNKQLVSTIQENIKKKGPPSKIIVPATEEIKIKTLAEIRAERLAKSEENKNGHRRKLVTDEEKEEAEVTSTSTDENVLESTSQNIEVRKKIKLRRKLPMSPSLEDMIASSNGRNESDETDSQISLEQEYRLLQENNEDFENNYEIDHGQKSLKKSRNDVNLKAMDENMLLEADDDEYENITIKAEDELLDEIDSFISD